MPAIKLKKVTAEYLAEKEKAAEKEKSKKTLEDNDEEGEEEAKPYNFLDVEVLWDKRKRTVPVADQKLIEWLDTNLEAKTDVSLPLLTLYEYYSEVCQMQGTPVIDVPVFNRYIKDKFGKFFGFQENSPYKALIKERKRMEKKPKKEGESGQLKIRDIIREVIEAAGNPRKGLRYSVINKAIMQKYPAHRIGMTPKKLKAALERGIYFGHIHLVRGVGMCGYYRLPGEPTIEEEPEKEKDEGKDEAKEGVEMAENGAEDSAEMAESTEKEEKTGSKRKAEGDDGKDASPRKKQKKKSKKKKQSKEMYRSEASRHSDPQKVEDAFPLAITFQSDPKECSAAKIRNYISKYYHVDVNPDRLKSALEKGVEKGMWEVTKGSGVQGTYHLLIGAFNPARSDNLGDQILQALIACHEPKSASVGLIKKYITQYHPKLNIQAKPHLLKAALERAIKKGAIRQLSGVGASGSFQLVYQFSPSPAILAGDASDEEEDEEDDNEEEEAIEYKPRPTKRGRIAERKLTNIAHTPKQRGKPIPKGSKKGKSKGKAAGAKPSKRARKSVSQSSDDDDDEVELTVEEYTPRKTKSRGGSSARATPQSAAKSRKSSAKPATPAKKATSASKEGNSAKKVSGKSTSKPASPKKGKATPKKNSRVADSEDEGVNAMSDDDEPISDQEEYIPKPSKRRGGLAEESLGKGSGKKQSSKSRRK